MRTRDILIRHPGMGESVVAFIHMDGDIVGKLLPRLSGGTDVVHNGRHVQIFLLNDRLRKDMAFRQRVWRRINRTCAVGEGIRKLGLTLDQVILLHMLQAVDRGYATPTGPETFIDNLNWWHTKPGRQTWAHTALELDDMWEKSEGSNCRTVVNRNN